jgi:hypothetical protein
MLNETNITVGVANVLINSQTETNNFWTLFVQLVQLLTPIISIGATAYIAYYSMQNSARNIFIQANQEKINEAITNLDTIIRTGKPDQIVKFLNSSEGIYIPEPLKTKIRKKSSAKKINQNQIDKMIDEINKYISP